MVTLVLLLVVVVLVVVLLQVPHRQNGFPVRFSSTLSFLVASTGPVYLPT
jgi:hypothetical protein